MGSSILSSLRWPWFSQSFRSGFRWRAPYTDGRGAFPRTRWAGSPGGSWDVGWPRAEIYNTGSGTAYLTWFAPLFITAASAIGAIAYAPVAAMFHAGGAFGSVRTGVVCDEPVRGAGTGPLPALTMTV